MATGDRSIYTLSHDNDRLPTKDSGLSLIYRGKVEEAATGISMMVPEDSLLLAIIE